MRFIQVRGYIRRYSKNDAKKIKRNPLTYKVGDYFIIQEEPGGRFYIAYRDGPAFSKTFSSLENAIKWINQIEKMRILKKLNKKELKLYIDCNFISKVGSLEEANNILRKRKIRKSFTKFDWQFAKDMKKGDRVCLDIDGRDIYLEK